MSRTAAGWGRGRGVGGSQRSDVWCQCPIGSEGVQGRVGLGRAPAGGLPRPVLLTLCWETGPAWVAWQPVCLHRDGRSPRLPGGSCFGVWMGKRERHSPRHLSACRELGADGCRRRHRSHWQAEAGGGGGPHRLKLSFKIFFKQLSFSVILYESLEYHIVVRE